MRNHLSTLLLSLLLCATCLAQPDSRPGPYQATLAKINALLVGGAATVKEVEFTVDGASLESSSKSQIFADGNAGSIIIGAPAGKTILLKGGGSQKLYTGNSGVVAVDHFYANKNVYFNGAGTSTSAATSMWTDAASGNLTCNVPTGKYEQHRVAGAGLLSLGRVGPTQGDTYWSIGKYCANGVYSTGSGWMSLNTDIFGNVPIGKSYKFQVAGSEKYRFSAALAEMDRISLGGTIGSSTDPGPGGLYCTGNGYVAGDVECRWSKVSALMSRAANSLTYVFGANDSSGSSTGAYMWLGSNGQGGVAAGSIALACGSVAGGKIVMYDKNSALQLQVDENGIKLPVTASPASNGTGTAGQIAWDTDYIYVCVSTNTWKRAALTGGY